MDLSTIDPAIAMLAVALFVLGGLAVMSHLFGADSRELGIRDGRPVHWLVTRPTGS